MASLKEQLLRDRIEAIQQSNGLPADEAFERLVYSLITGESVHTPNLTDWVDGGQDKQIDIVNIQENEADADVHIIQAKGSNSFSSNSLILMANGLDWIFKKSRSELKTLSNSDFRDKITELRSVMAGVGYGNVRVHCYYACFGEETKISDEFEQEKEAIMKTYNNGAFETFSFTPLGVVELVELLSSSERKNKAINTNLKIR